MGGSFVRVFIAAVCLSWLAVVGSLQAQARPDSTSTDSVRIDLAPIEVRVTRVRTPDLAVPFSISRLTSANLRRGRVTAGLDEALVEVPGVFVANRYNQSLDQRVSIRGFGARSAFGVRGVKVLLDGIPQTLPDGQGQLSNLELSTIESIEVLRGTASSLYGNASGGVIDIRTQTPHPLQAQSSFRIAGGSFGLLKSTAMASAPVGLGTIALQASHTRMGGYRDHSDSRQYQFGARFEQSLDPNTLLLVTGQFATSPTLDNPGSLNGNELASDPSQANPGNLAANAGKSVHQWQVGVTLRRAFTPGTEWSTTAFALGRDLDNPLSFAYINLGRRAIGVRSELQVAGELGSVPTRLTLGTDIQHQRDDRIEEESDRSAVTLDQVEQVLEVGPFARIAMDVGDFTFSVGGRYDRVAFDATDEFLSDGDDTGSRVMSSLSGSIGVVYHGRPAFRPFANVSTSFETPTTTELINRPTGGGGINQQLDPQKATTFEFGVRGDLAAKFGYSISVFTAEIRDALVPFEVPTDASRRFFQNAGTSRHRGVELSATVQPVGPLVLRTSYTFADYTFQDFTGADGTFDGNHIPGVPKHHWYGSARVTLNSGVWLSTDHTYTSSVFLDDANSNQADGWFVTGVRAGWEGKLGRLGVSPFIGVLNVFDQQYVGSVVVNAAFGRYFEPAPGRNAYLGVEITP